MNQPILRSYSIFTRFRNSPTICCSLYNSLNYGRNSNDITINKQFYRFASDDAGKALTTKQKLKTLVAEYGTTVIVFHVTISLASLGTCYALISNGVDIGCHLETLGLGGGTTETKVAAGAGTFVVAYAVHKMFAPLRLGVTAVSVPLIVRYLRNKGFLMKK